MKILNYYRLIFNNSTKKHFLTILFFSLINTAGAQLTFQRGYTDSNASRLIAALQTSDGNFIAAGSTFPGNKGRMCLVKTDLTGDTIWTKTYGTIEHVKCNTIQQTADNGFILGGRMVDTIIGDSKSLLIKTDVNGNVVWSKAYDSSHDKEILSVKENPNGDYFIAGFGFVAKVNSIGNTLWEKELNDYVVNFGVGVTVDIHSLDITDDGGIILGGSIDTTFVVPSGIFQQPSCVYLQKMSASGNIMWTKAYKSIHNIFDEGSSVAQTSDKGFILTGQTYVPVGVNVSMNHIYLIKTDSLGNLTWSKKFDSGANDTGSDVKQTSDGGYIVTGTSNGFVGNGLWTSNSFLIKTNSNGNVSWCKYYGSADNAGDQSASVNIVSDGGYLVSGITTGPNGFPENMYLLKTDASGNVNCRGFNWPLYDSTYLSTGNSINQTITNSASTAGSPVINTTHMLCSHYGDCTVGLTELEKDLSIKIYPNPNNGIFKIQIDTEITSGKLILTNPLGQKVFEQIVNQGINEIISSSLPKGIYLYTLIENYQTKHTGKIVLE